MSFGECFVRGLPISKGSGTRGLITARCRNCGRTLPPGVGRLGPHVHQGNVATKSRPAHALDRWEATIGATLRNASRYWDGKCAPRTEPVEVSLDFRFERPPAQRRGTLGHGIQEYVSPPDIDKLVRAVLDGCTGVLFEDDAQVCVLRARKHYGEEPGVLIEWRWHSPHSELWEQQS